jgi:hypothetical protein
MAKRETPSAFLKRLRWMAIDGTVFDLPDTEENSRVFGYPGSRKGTKAAFPPQIIKKGLPRYHFCDSPTPTFLTQKLYFSSLRRQQLNLCLFQD